MTSSTKRNTNHDAIASMYDLKGTERHDIALECLDELILQHIPNVYNSLLENGIFAFEL